MIFRYDLRGNRLAFERKGERYYNPNERMVTISYDDVSRTLRWKCQLDFCTSFNTGTMQWEPWHTSAAIHRFEREAQHHASVYHQVHATGVISREFWSALGFPIGPGN